MPSVNGHRPGVSISQNQRAVLASAYNELGKELSSSKIRVVGNYTLSKVIGEGSYGKVRMGTHRLTGSRVAIKHIPKAMSAHLTREIHHHRQLHHPHITQMYEVIATENSIWIVTELCLGGELFDYLVEKGRLSETETKAIFGQLCLAVSYLHEKGVVHRDLKLENVLLDEWCKVKLGDFGFTREWERGVWMETFCGTTGYAAPEMLQCLKYQGPEVDIWSLGVILFCLLTGALPFDDDDESVMRSMIIEGAFEDPEWLSPEARDLIKSILVIDPMKRPSLSQILSHTWFTTPEPPPLSTEQDVLGGEQEVESPEGPSNPSEPQTPVDTKFKRRSTSSSILPPPPHAVRTPARTKRRSMSSAVSSPSPSPYSSDCEDEGGLDTVPPSPRPPFLLRHAPQQDFAVQMSKKPPLIFSTDKERELLNFLSVIGLDTGQIVHSVLTDACDSSGAIWWLLSRKFESPSALPADDRPSLHPSDTKKPQHPHHHSHRKFVNAGSQTDSQTSMILKSTSDAPKLSFVPPTPTSASNRPATPPTGARSDSSTPLLTPSSSSLSNQTVSGPSSPSSGATTKGRKGRSGSVSIMQRATTALEAAGLVRKKSSDGIKDLVPQHRDGSSSTSSSSHVVNAPERKSSLASSTESYTSGTDSPRSSSVSNKLTKSPPKASPLNNLPSTPPPSSSAETNVGSPWVLASAHQGAASSSSLLSHATVHDPHSSSTSARATPTLEAPSSSSLPPNQQRLSPGPTNDQGRRNASNTSTAGRNKANLLATFKLWFGDDRAKEDKKGKRKAALRGSTSPGPSGQVGIGRLAAGGAVKRRTSSGGGSSGGGKNRFNVGGRRQRAGGHSQRPSISSRRSSSVNSRRSSAASVQQTISQQHPPITPSTAATRKTVSPTSSRPSSIRSFQMGSSQLPSGSASVVHRKSPSASSVGENRPQSPLQRYHTRAGSGSSHTRVVRSTNQRPRSSGAGDGKRHGRNNSAASSVTSSRRGSWYGGDKSDAESISRTSLGGGSKYGEYMPRSSSPYRSRKTSFLAQKRTAPFTSPSSGGSIGRSSWKKSWGMEPPGWSTRSINTQQAHSGSIFTSSGTAIEVLAISPAGPAGGDMLNIRDVFSNKEKASPMDEDEDDWVDEDDYDLGAFVGGLGQMGTKAGGSTVGSAGVFGGDAPGDGAILLAPAPRHPKWGAKQKGAGSNGGMGGSPAVAAKPLPVGGGSSGSNGGIPETFEGTSRRQLPAGRMRPPIVMEEDEEEEE